MDAEHRRARPRGDAYIDPAAGRRARISGRELAERFGGTRSWPSETGVAVTSDSGIRSLQVAEHVWILSAPGERDLADVAALREEIDRVCAMGSTLVCDLSSTTFIDSSVIGVLVYAASRSDADARHRFTIVGTGEQPRAPSAGDRRDDRVHDDR